MMKNALKNKMQKAIQIHIHVAPVDKEAEKSSDLAPMVHDSDEPGVDKGDLAKKLGVGAEYAAHEAKESPEYEAMEEGSPLMQPEHLKNLINRMPTSKSGIHAGAKEKMKQRLEGLKKGNKI